MFLILDLITGLCCTVKNIFNSLVACVTSSAVNLEFSLGRRRRWPGLFFCWFVCCLFSLLWVLDLQCPWQHFHKTDYSVCVAEKKDFFSSCLKLLQWLLTDTELCIWLLTLHSSVFLIMYFLFSGYLFFQILPLHIIDLHHYCICLGTSVWDTVLCVYILCTCCQNNGRYLTNCFVLNLLTEVEFAIFLKMSYHVNLKVVRIWHTNDTTFSSVSLPWSNNCS